jgi:hypothetical protein
MRGLVSLGAAVALLATAPLVGPLVELLDEPGLDEPVRMASGATVEGDPASDEETQARAEAGGEHLTVRLEQTPAPLVDGLPVGEEVREASPVGPVDADLRLKAGPAVLDGEGSLSPAYPLEARLTVDAEDDFDEAWLRLDGEPTTRMDPAGEDDDRRVLLADVDPHVLPAGGDTHVDAVFERDAGPAATQRVEGPGMDVHADTEGPAPPHLHLEEDQIRVEGEAHRYEAQARNGSEDWRSTPVDDDTVVTEANDSEVRARGVDGLGNAGTWSSPLEVPPPHDTGSVADPWRLLAPEAGAHLAGVVEIEWRPPSGVLVEARVDLEDGETRLVDRAQEPPVRWRTSFVPDGDHQLHVRALQDGNWTSRVLPVTVDNLEETTVAETEEGETQPPAASVDPRTRSPWSAALATGIGLVALAGLIGRAWTRRPK